MLELNNISKKYKKGSEEFVALDNISIKIEKGDYLAVTGPSGSGKSTLLNVIGGLIRPDYGEVLYNGENIYLQNSRLTDEYRKRHVGFMFQQFHLMPYLNILENIKLACNNSQQYKGINGYVEKCSLKTLINKYPSELSVGEKQRAAFVRAIICRPEILLADEPTGNLDPDNSSILMTLIKEFHDAGGTIVLVSHDRDATRYSDRIITLERGRIKF
jgi:ABC-type lipoprotein export system ATPase subunit